MWPSQWGLFWFLSRWWQRAAWFSCIGLGCWYLRCIWQCTELTGEQCSVRGTHQMTHTMFLCYLKGWVIQWWCFQDSGPWSDSKARERKYRSLTRFNYRYPQELLSWWSWDQDNVISRVKSLVYMEFITVSCKSHFEILNYILSCYAKGYFSS